MDHAIEKRPSIHLGTVSGHGANCLLHATLVVNFQLMEDLWVALCAGSTDSV